MQSLKIGMSLCASPVDRGSIQDVTASASSMVDSQLSLYACYCDTCETVIVELEIIKENSITVQMGLISNSCSNPIHRQGV